MAKKEIVKAEEEKVGHVEEAGEVGLMVKKTETMQEQEFQKQMVKERVFDLQVDAEKLDKDADKLQVPKQATKAIKIESKAEKAGNFFLTRSMNVHVRLVHLILKKNIKS